MWTLWRCVSYVLFFFNRTGTTGIYTSFPTRRLPIFGVDPGLVAGRQAPGLQPRPRPGYGKGTDHQVDRRSEEHTSELQSQSNLVCRLLLEKKKFAWKRGRCVYY